MSNETATSILEDAEVDAELTDGKGRVNARGVEAISTRKDKMHPTDEEAALNFFLADDGDVDEEITLRIPRSGIRLKFRSIEEDELKRLQKRSAKEGKRLPNGNREVDLLKLYRLILIETMTTPNLKSSQIMDKFGTPEDALKAKLKPGEIEKAAEYVMAESGFHDDSVILEDDENEDETNLAKN